MTPTRAAQGLTTALCLALATPALALDVDRLDPDTIAALTADGPLVVLAGDDDGRLTMAIAVILVDGPPDAVWDALADFESYPEWMPQTRATEVERGDDAVTVAYTLQFELVISKKVRYTLVFHDRGDHRMEYRLVDGDVSRNEGYWEVRPHGDRSILYYANYYDYASMRMLRPFLQQQPSLELALGASGVAVVARAVKKRVEDS